MYQVDIETNTSSKQLPPIATLESWIKTVLKSQQLDEAEVSVYIVDEAESQELNSQYRGRSRKIHK